MPRSIPAFLTSAFAAFLLLAGVQPAPHAAPPNVGCDGFLWPLETEIALMKAGGEAVDSGTTLPAPSFDKAVAMSLKPATDVSLPAKPTSTPKPDDGKKYAGFVNFANVEKGHYQVTLSGPGWIDVVQNGAPLEATAHTGSGNCEYARKSVRFEISDGPLGIQVHGVQKDHVKFTIRPSAD